MDAIPELRFGEYLFSTEKDKLDVGVIYGWLSTSYWSPGIARELVVKSIENSICIGIYKGIQQVGFARIITDMSTFAYLADVFVDESHRNQGLSKKMMEWIMTFDFVPGLRRFLLATLDAHGLYEQYGFKLIERPDRFMEIHKPDIYATKPTTP